MIFSSSETEAFTLDGASVTPVVDGSGTVTATININTKNEKTCETLITVAVRDNVKGVKFAVDKYSLAVGTSSVIPTLFLEYSSGKLEPISDGIEYSLGTPEDVIKFQGGGILAVSAGTRTLTATYNGMPSAPLEIRAYQRPTVTGIAFLNPEITINLAELENPEQALLDINADVFKVYSNGKYEPLERSKYDLTENDVSLTFENSQWKMQNTGTGKRTIQAVFDDDGKERICELVINVINTTVIPNVTMSELMLGFGNGSGLTLTEDETLSLPLFGINTDGTSEILKEGITISYNDADSGSFASAIFNETTNMIDIEAKKKGTDKITINYNKGSVDLTMSFSVGVTEKTIKEPTVTGIFFSNRTIQMLEGSTIDLDFMAVLSNGTYKTLDETMYNDLTFDGKTEYKSEYLEIEKVNGKWKMTALAQSATAQTVTVTFEGYEGTTISVIIIPKKEVTGIEFEVPNMTLRVKNTAQLRVMEKYNDGTFKYVEATYESSDSDAATVDKNSGLVEGVSVGNTVISATYGTNTVTMEVSVEEDQGKPIESVEFANKELNLSVNATHKGFAICTYDDGTKDIIPLEDLTIVGITDKTEVNHNVTVEDGLIKAGNIVCEGIKITATYKTSEPFTMTVNVLAEPVTLISFAFEANPKEIVVGETNAVYAVAVYNNGERHVIADSYTSSDEKIATVDAWGNVKVIAADTVTITAKYSGETVEKEINIKADDTIKLREVSFGSSLLEIPVGETRQLAPLGIYINNTFTEFDIQPIILSNYSSSDSDVATVNQSGVITGVSEGDVDITATHPGTSKTAKISVRVVKSKEIESVQFANNVLNLSPGEEHKLFAICTYDDGTKDIIPLSQIEDVSISSSNVTIEDGLIKAGNIVCEKVEITAKYKTSEPFTMMVNVLAEPVTLETISFEQEPTAVHVNETKPLYLKATFSNDDSRYVIADEYDFNSDIVDVDAIGNVKGIAADTVTITATYKGMTAEKAITISEDNSNALRYVTLGVTPISLTVDETKQLTLMGIYSNNSQTKFDAEKIVGATFTSSKPEIVTVDNNGKITGVKDGTATIIATYNDTFEATITITVELDEETNTLVKTTLGTEEIILTPTETRQLTLMGLYANKAMTEFDVKAISNVKFYSNNPDFVMVDENTGLLTAGVSVTSHDKVTIFATPIKEGNTFAAKIDVTVSLAEVENIEFVQDTYSMFVGETLTPAVLCTYVNGRTVILDPTNYELHVPSSDFVCAGGTLTDETDDKATVTALKKDKTTIEVKYNGKTAEATVKSHYKIDYNVEPIEDIFENVDFEAGYHVNMGVKPVGVDNEGNPIVYGLKQVQWNENSNADAITDFTWVPNRLSVQWSGTSGNELSETFEFVERIDVGTPSKDKYAPGDIILAVIKYNDRYFISSVKVLAWGDVDGIGKISADDAIQIFSKMASLDFTGYIAPAHIHDGVETFSVDNALEILRHSSKDDIPNCLSGNCASASGGVGASNDDIDDTERFLIDNGLYTPEAQAELERLRDEINGGQDPTDPTNPQSSPFLYTQDNGKVTITGLADGASVTDLVIPSTIDGLPVISVADNAFKDNNTIENVTTPDSIVNIGTYAFSNCSNLQTAVIGNGVTTIGNYIFANCTKLQSVELGSSVTGISQTMFANCTKLDTVIVKNPSMNFGVNCLYSTPASLVIKGYNNSTAKTFAQASSKTFVLI